MTDCEYIKTWFSKAEQDLRIIEQGMDRPETDWVSNIFCFHAQQAVEKALKVFLIAGNRNPPHTHSIEILFELCRQIDNTFPEYMIRDLSYFAVESRYPDEFYEPDAQETRYYANLAN